MPGSEEDDVACFGKPATGFEAGDVGMVHCRLGGEIEIGDRLDRRESRGSNTKAGTRFGAGIGFHRQHGGQIVLQRPLRGPALLGDPGIVLGDPRCFEEPGLMGDQLVGIGGCAGTYGGHQATSPVPNARS